MNSSAAILCGRMSTKCYTTIAPQLPNKHSKAVLEQPTSTGSGHFRYRHTRPTRSRLAAQKISAASPQFMSDVGGGKAWLGCHCAAGSTTGSSEEVIANKR